MVRALAPLLFCDSLGSPIPHGPTPSSGWWQDYDNVQNYNTEFQVSGRGEVVSFYAGSLAPSRPHPVSPQCSLARIGSLPVLKQLLA